MAVTYGDLHIHIGRTRQGRPVKITASPQLTLETIPKVAKQKGLGLLGIVDAGTTGVLADLQRLLDDGEMAPLSGGGYRYQDVVLLLGHEIELAHHTGKEAHFLAFFPDLDKLETYAKALAPWVTNPSLSTQRTKLEPDAWVQLVSEQGGTVLAAHAFTPHKGVYGNCVRVLGEMFADSHLIRGLELGLSANVDMALQIKDTHRFAYVSNSDAHSLGTIAREFTVYDLPVINFEEWVRALDGRGQGILATHGLEPLLGKYYRSYCKNCQLLVTNENPHLHCPNCSKPMIVGVWDRLREIRDFSGPSEPRPPYRSHVPLMMIPGVGPKVYEKLLRILGTEIEILYSVSLEAITGVAGISMAQQIDAVRRGTAPILPGGGGKYGRVTKVP